MDLFKSIELQKKNIKISVSHRIEKLILKGHPWVFDTSILHQKGEGPPGTPGVIFDKKNRFLAIGFYDPFSPIRLRILQKGKPELIDGEFFKKRLIKAFSAREIPNTTGYRLIYGESDSFPGLVMDQYEDTLVMKLYTPSWIPHLNKILSPLQEIFPHRRMVLRLNRHCKKYPDYLYGLKDGQILYGEPLMGPVIFRENGLNFEADVLKGQKTGFFLDQRDNRSLVESMSRGKKVLNIFCYTGGFSLYAARGGAKKIVSIDLIQSALDGLAKNFSLNPDLPTVNHKIIRGDAFSKLTEFKKEKFDLIILDPPSFAKKEAHKERAIKAYQNINSLALKVLEENGILVTCSCSTHVTEKEFEYAVLESLRNKTFKILKKTGHPTDHPVSFKEGRYLKALFIQVN